MVGGGPHGGGARPGRPVCGSAYRVVVLGAGYAGVIAANRIQATVALRLDRDRDAAGRAVEVTVVNPRAEFVQRIRLHEVAAGTTATAVVPLREVLHPAVALQVGWARRIDPRTRTVHGQDWSLEYDNLVYAVGSRAATRVPGSEVHARPVGEPAGAQVLRDDVAGLAAGAVVAVVGGGLTGIETAAEFAERRPELAVHLISSAPIGGALSPRGRRLLRRALDRLGVVRHEGVSVTRVLRDRVILADGGQLAFDVCAWAGSMVAPELAADSGLAVDRLRRLLVDETLRHPEHPETVGAGDAVAPPARVASHLRMSCAAALPLGGHAAEVVLTAIDAAQGRPAPVRRLSVGFALQCISLGRDRGVVQVVRADDTPRPLAFGGRAAAVTKERICRYTLASLVTEATRPGAYLGVAGPHPKDPPTAGARPAPAADSAR